jgi:hypothetical protein
MQPLKEANVQKCLDLLDDFHEAVSLDERNQELMEKKAQARQALDHLGQLFSRQPGDIELGKTAVCESKARNCRD